MSTVTATPTADTACAPWYASLALTAGEDAPARARSWLTDSLARAGVAPRYRAEVRRAGTEMAREAALLAPGEEVLVEIDVVGPIVRLSTRGRASTLHLGARVVDALQAAYEWGVERTTGGRRTLWCHLELA